MKNSLYDKQLGVFYGQVDRLQSQLPGHARTDLDRTIELLGDVKYLSIPLSEAISGIRISIEALCKKISNPNQVFEGYLNRVIALHIETFEEYQEVNFKNFMMLDVRPKERLWQLFVRIGKAESNYSEELKEFLGAYFLLRFDGKQTVRKDLPDILFKFSNGGKDGLSQTEYAALGVALVKARGVFSETEPSILSDQELSFDDLVRRIFRCKLEYADSKAKQGALDYKTLSIPIFCSMALKLRLECEAGNSDSAKILLASFIGIPFKHIDKLPLLHPGMDDWGVVLDPVEGVVKFDLDLVLPNGAQGEGKEYTKGSTILVKPLPEFLRAYLKARMSNSFESPECIGQLLGADINSEYTYEKIAKFINSAARAAIQLCDIDPFLAGLITNDFRILPKSKGYYRQTSRKDVWAVATKFFNEVGWGNPAPLNDGLSFGSKAVVTDHAVQNLFRRLASEVQSRPSNNATICRLLNFHDKFTVYVACLSVFSLALRESKRLPIYADNVAKGQRYIILNDKSVHGRASFQPVTINQILQEQFLLYISHCESLFDRLKVRNDVDRNFIKALHGIVCHEHVPFLVTTELPLGISTAYLIKSLGKNIVGNFGRHYWETNFPQYGITSRESAAHLRHQSSAGFNWDSGSDLILSDLITRIDDAQVNKLTSLHIQAVEGLVGRLMK